MNSFTKISYLFVFIFSICVISVNAQTVPQGITYQGLARNSSGLVISNQAISIKLGIYSPTVTGVKEWEEIHNLTTNQFGLFYLIIGQGSSTGSGSVSSFNMINWGSASHFIKIAMDPTG